MNVNDRKVEAIHKVLVHVLDPETHKDSKTDLSDIPLCSRLRSSTHLIQPTTAAWWGQHQKH